MQLLTKLMAILLLVLAGCAGDPYQRTKIGAGGGAAAGAALGYALGEGKGAAIGGAVGALAGGLIGKYMDDQQQALEQALAEERSRNQVGIQRLPDGSIRLDIPSEVTFDFDSAAVKPAFRPSLTKVGSVLQQYSDTTVQVVGHTDSVGSEVYNLGLSQRRAESVASFLNQQGVASQRLMTEGRGKLEPRASNATEAGRQQNRRVEMFIRPIARNETPAGYPPPSGGYGAPPAGGYGPSPSAPPPSTYPSSNYPPSGYPPSAYPPSGYPPSGRPPSGSSQGGYGTPVSGAAEGYPPGVNYRYH